MARNPFAAALGYLRGDDLKALAPGAPTVPVETPAAPEQEQKYGFTPSSYVGGWPLGVLGDPGYSSLVEAARVGILVNGPGATGIYAASRSSPYDWNSAVFACLNKLCTAYGEPPLRVYQGDAEGGTPDVVADHPLEELVANPDPFIPGPILWYWVQWAKHAAGNAYLRKVRAGAGNVVQLTPLSPTLIEPYTTEADWDKGILISGYRYEYKQGKYEDLPPEDIVHFRLGLNDADPRVGCSPLQRLAREVFGDEAAKQFTTSLLANTGIPGLVVTVQKDAVMTREQAVELEQYLASKYGSDRRGRPTVLSPGSDMKQFGFSPEQMNLSGVQRLFEERISAVLGVPAIVAGLGAGLDRSTYSNFAQAMEAFTTTTLVPLWVADAATMNQQLLPDFAGPQTGRTAKLFAQFDLTNVRALQEDEDKKYGRLNLGVQGGWIAPQEARRDVGLPEEPGLDGILYIPGTVTPTPVDEVGTPPAPPPAPTPPTDGQQPPGTQGPQDGQKPQAQAQDQGAQSAQAAGKALTRLLATKRRQVPLGDFPELLAALADLAEPALTKDLQDYLDGQRERVTSRLLAGAVDPHSARAALPRTNGTVPV